MSYMCQYLIRENGDPRRTCDEVATVHVNDPLGESHYCRVHASMRAAELMTKAINEYVVSMSRFTTAMTVAANELAVDLEIFAASYKERSKQ